MIRAKLRVALNHHREGRLDSAVELYESILLQMPNHPQTLLSLGAAYLGLSKYAQAIIHLETALSVRPDHPDTCFALAEAYRASGRIEDAYRTAVVGLKGNPDYLPGRMAAADALLDLGRHDEARANFVNILAKTPDNISVLAKMGAFHYHVGEFCLAEQKLSAAAQILTNDPEVHWHLASLYLSERRWEKGWSLYKWRWRVLGRNSPESILDLPRWDGGSILGKRILVWCEQGLGDELMFATCLPDLLGRGKPTLCVLVCDKRLAAVFCRNFPAIRIVGVDREDELKGARHIPTCDLQVAAGDLPASLRKTDEDFSSNLQRLTANPESVVCWKKRLDRLGAGLKVGIAWRGGTLERFKRTKSSNLLQWQEILNVPGVIFINLQYGNCLEELNLVRATGVPVHYFEDLDPIADPEGQMALISALDLVIQTSNASAHMAGALGIPVWNMVPYVPDWRWGLEGNICLWYPSMRLFRQPALGEWAPVFSSVADQLQKFVEKKN